MDEMVKEVDDALGIDRTEKTRPMYQVIGEKIPVSSHFGMYAQTLFENGVKRQKKFSEAWKQAIQYYENDQIDLRGSATGYSSAKGSRSELDGIWKETENIIFANATAMMPTLYAKNPKGEFTVAGNNELLKRYATLVERLVNELVTRKVAPGVGMKPKARKCVLSAHLTNAGWLSLGWNNKQDVGQSSLNDLMELGKKLEKAKSAEEILEIEGKLSALEQNVQFLRDAGPELRFLSPFRVVVDPTAEDPYLQDAEYLFEIDYLPTQFIRAKYGQKKGEMWNSLYKPSHQLAATNDMPEGYDFGSFSTLPGEDLDELKMHGYDDEMAFKSTDYTKVCKLWHRPTQRVYLFNYDDWSWPLWVWDDPLKLDRFFPYYLLQFHTDLGGLYSKGEVSYALDQQDAINDINSERALMRKWASRNVLFDKSSISEEDVRQYLSGPDGTAKGVDLKNGKKLGEVVYTVPPPSVQYESLFDKSGPMQAADRILSTTDVLRGMQFKTNTTNKAVDTYNATTQLRVDEKVDAIEDVLGDVMWGMAQLCMMNMEAEDVSKLLNEDVSQIWRRMEPDELRYGSYMEVVGGSTVKPSSKAKKEEAIEVGQVLGQFASASPLVLLAVLELFKSSFDGINMKEETWEEIKQDVQMRVGGEQGQGQGAQPNPLDAARQELINRGYPPEQVEMVIAKQQGMN